MLLNKDKAGRVVISTDDGMVLLDSSTLTELARLSLPTTNGMRSHAFSPGQQAMIMIKARRPRELIVTHW